MNREIHRWWSHSLHREMDLAVFGHYGTPLVFFPTADSDFLEYESHGAIDAIADFINGGRCKLYCVSNINGFSWLDESRETQECIQIQAGYNKYITNELVPFIYNHCHGRVPIYTAGASFGAYHAANNYFRRPDLFGGTLALSGFFDIAELTDEWFDQDCYFNSPIHYIPQLSEERILHQIEQGKIVIATGQGEYETPTDSLRFSEVLSNKGIKHTFDLWGLDMPHDWPTWHQMLRCYLPQLLR